MNLKFKSFLFVFSYGYLILLLVSCTANSEGSKSMFLNVGDKVDSLNGVYVFYNGSVNNVEGRNTTSDGYNLGLKYQCVEFVKRYYYEFFNHKMPDSWGHAKSFYDKGVRDGKLNTTRDLIQFSNPSRTKPKVNDLIVFDGTTFNEYGHVAIISKVKENEIEIIQQNPGRLSKPRVTYTINFKDGYWLFNDSTVLGWLRKN